MPPDEPLLQLSEGERVRLCTTWSASGVSFTLVRADIRKPFAPAATATLARNIMLSGNMQRAHREAKEEQEAAADTARQDAEREERERLGRERAHLRDAAAREREYAALQGFDEQKEFLDRQRKKAGQFAQRAEDAATAAVDKRFDRLLQHGSRPASASTSQPPQQQAKPPTRVYRSKHLGNM